MGLEWSFDKVGDGSVRGPIQKGFWGELWTTSGILGIESPQYNDFCSWNLPL